MRDGDIAGRFGGEEFLAILPETGQDGATRIAERLRLAVRGRVVEWEDSRIRVTVSIGVTEIASGESLEKAIARADQALYQAKRNGRDRVEVLAADPPEAVK